MSAPSSTILASARGLRDTLSSRAKPELFVTAAGVALIIASWANTAIRTTQPLVYADEAGYLIHARGFAGLGEFYGNSYHPGFGLLISPSLRLFESFHAAFRGVQVVNLALILITFWLMVRVVRRVVPAAHPAVAPVAATIVLIYPSWAGFAALALPECLLLAMATGTYLLALEGFEGHRPWALPMGAFLAGLIPLVHPRAAVVPIAWALVVLLGLALRRLDLRQAATVTIAGLFGATLTVWVLSVTSVPSNEESMTGVGFLTRLLEVENALSYPSVVLGHWFYAAAATAGLIPLGWLVLGRRSTSSLAALVTVLSATFALLISAAFMLNGLTDKAIYGRYAEPFVAVFAAIGLATLLTNRKRWHLLVMVASIGVPAAIVRLTRHAGDFAGSYNRSNVLTLVPIIDELGGIRLGWIALVTVTLAVLVWLGASDRVRAVPAVGLLALVMLGAGGINAMDYFDRDVRIRAQSGHLALLVEEAHHEATGERLDCISLDRRSLGQWYRYNYQVHLYRTRFNQVLPPTPEITDCSPWILSTQPDIATLVPGARLVGLEAHARVGLWVAPGPAQTALAEADRLFPAEWSGPIPDSARAYDVELLTAASDGEDLVVELRIHHIGSGSLWPGASGMPQGINAPVRVAVGLVESTHDGPLQPPNRLNIPPMVAPGEQFVIEARIPWQDSSSLVRAHPVMTVELVQEGVRWFPGTARFDLSDWL